VVDITSAQRPEGEQKFGKAKRILASARFTTIIKEGRHVADPILVVNALPRPIANGVNSRDAASSAERLRIGITIPKKTGNAVVRNRWKRVIREAFRCIDPARHLPQLPPTGLDIVVRPRRGASADFVAVQQSLLQLIRRAAK
jgi:ribonuclease P protein component